MGAHGEDRLKRFETIEETAHRILQEKPDPVVRFRLLRDVLRLPPDTDMLVNARREMLLSQQILELKNEQKEDGSWGRFHSAIKTKGNNLPPLQKRILLYLAKHEPQTINETVKGIRSRQYRSSYKSSWIAFNSLEKKGLIKKTDVKTYRGREYPRFWLSSAGVFIALVEGSSAQDLLEKTIKAYPSDKVLQCCLEIAPFTGIEGYRVALSAILSKGKLEQSDATTMMLTQMEKDLSINQFKRFLEVLKRYPEEYEKLKKQIEQLDEFLDKMEEII